MRLPGSLNPLAQHLTLQHDNHFNHHVIFQ